MAKGAWRALEAVATDNSGTMQACLGSSGGGRTRKAVDAARDLLLLPCVGASPVDIITCYARCRGAGAGQGAAVAAAEVGLKRRVGRGEVVVSFPRKVTMTYCVLMGGARFVAWTLFPTTVASFVPFFYPLCLLSVVCFGDVSHEKRALRELARVSLCEDIDSLLRAVSAVMAADYNGEDGDDPAEPFGDENAGGTLPEGCASNSLSEVTARTCTVGATPSGKCTAF